MSEQSASQLKMNSAREFSRRWEDVCEVLWATALILLPLTSFPLLSSLYSGLVAPISILPFFILLLIWTLPLVLRRGVLPKETTPLLIFTLAVLVSCAAAFFIPIPGFKGRSILGQEVRQLLTLAVGVTFFLVTSSWIKNTGKLKNTWKYITIGGIVSLIWAGIQAFFILRQVNEYPLWLNQIQSWLVVRSIAFSPKYGRVNGLTYEASWFAHQMVILYLPLWIAATYHRTSAFTLRIFRLSIENFLLVFGLVAFFLSSPRIGLISLLLMIIYIFLRVNIVFHRWVVKRLSGLRPFLERTIDDRKILLRALASFGIMAVYILVIAGVVVFVVHRDWRLSAIVSNPPTLHEIIGVLTLDQNAILELSHRFVFLERAIYWLNGWNVFNQYPWLGVGLGNSGFFFPQMAPSMGWATFEIRNVLFYLTQLPNVKSLWFRLLAETGLVGFSIFIGWIYTLFQSSKFGQHHPTALVKTFAFAGQLALLAFIGEGFSIDSFALPYIWVVAGFIAALAMMYRREAPQQKITN